MIRFGVHCSLKKGLLGSLEEAKAKGCEAMQIFTRSPRMWKMRPPPEDEVRAFIRRRKELGIRPLVVHTPYLPNLATSQERLYALSIASLREDLKVSRAIGADYFVIHPGSYSLEAAPEEGLRRIAAALNDVLAKDRGKTMILLENVAGGGRRLGGSFEELAAIIAGVKKKRRIGVCFDTAHALGAGYDIATKEGVKKTLDSFDRAVGLKRLALLHCNDSLVPCGSHRDRHQHLGRGYVGKNGFTALISAVKNIASAGILETPKDTETSDAENLARLFSWRVR